MRRFCVTARICRPSACAQHASSSSEEDEQRAKTTIQSRFQVIESWPISNEPDIQDGLPTSRLVGPKMVRTACCRISDMPQVASSVSSGRP
jgi:hypothetical protein